MSSFDESNEGMSSNANLFGKKIFFLNPPMVIKEVMGVLSEAEFEVYTVTDQFKLARYLYEHADCITFVNIDEGNNPEKWFEWIKKTREDSPSHPIPMGVVTTYNDKDIKSTYLVSLGLECGFIVVKMGAAKTTEILLKTLEINEARGRRRYIRALCPPESADFNCTINGSLIRGWIRDISVVGMSAVFKDAKPPKAGTILGDIQLTLKGIRIRLSGVVVGGHETEDIGWLSVIMFVPGSVNEEKRNKLRLFIHKTLQIDMDKQLNYI